MVKLKFIKWGIYLEFPIKTDCYGFRSRHILGIGRMPKALVQFPEYEAHKYYFPFHKTDKLVSNHSPRCVSKTRYWSPFYNKPKKSEKICSGYNMDSTQARMCAMENNEQFAGYRLLMSKRLFKAYHRYEEEVLIQILVRRP